MSAYYGPTTFEALTVGAPVTAATVGCTEKLGAGTAVVQSPGLFGSTRAAKLTSTSSARITFSQDVTGPRTYVGFDFQAPDGKPDGFVTPLLVAYDASDNVMGLVYFTPDGIIRVRDDGDEAIGDTDFAYCGQPDSEGGPIPGEAFHLLYRVDTDLKRQKLWIYKAGHYKELGPLDLGPNPVVRIEWGIGEINAFGLVIDNPLATADEVAIPEEIVVVNTKLGPPSSDGIEIHTYSFGYSSLRAHIYMPGQDDALLVTDEVEPTLFDRVGVRAAGLQPDTDYEYEIWGLSHGVWGAGSERGTFRTAPVPKRPVAWARLLADGCQLNGGLAKPEKTHVYVRDVAQANPLLRFHVRVNLGDLHYQNEMALEIGPHRQAIDAQLGRWPAYAWTFANIPTADWEPSDHDGGGNQHADFQDPATEFAIKAWMDSWPHLPPWDLGGEQTRACSMDYGRWRLVFPDFRTLARMDATLPDGPNKLAYSAAQEAKIIAEIDDYSNPYVVMFIDQPWPGNVADIHPKTDHMASYSFQRARINARIAARRAAGFGFFFVQGDYHGLVARDPGFDIDDTTGGAGLIGCCAARNNTGNLRPDDLPNYTQHWGEEQAPAPEKDIWVHGELTFIDDGLNMSLLAQGRDNDSGTYVVETGDTIAVQFVEPPSSPPSYDLGELVGYDPHGRWKVVRATTPQTVPAKSAAQLQPAQSDGRQISNVFVTGGQFSIVFGVTDLDATGTPGGRAQRDRNIRAIEGVASSRFELPIGFRQERTGPVTTVSRGYVLASVGKELYGPAYAELTVVVDLLGPAEHPTWQSTTVDLTDGDRTNVILPIFDSSTADVANYRVRFGGGFRTVAMFDRVTGRWFRITAPITGDPVGEDQAVIVNIGAWTAYLVDLAAGWDTSDGVAVNSWISSTQSGTSVLPLTHQAHNGDVDDYEVHVDFKIGSPTGSPFAEVNGPAGVWYS